MKNSARATPAIRDWESLYRDLSQRCERDGSNPAELEQLGFAAYLAGHDAESLEILTRAHSVALERREMRQAARAAFWVAFVLIGSRELTRASGWAGRARRLLEENRLDCVECGYVMIPHALELIGAGDLPGAESAFLTAEGIGDRFADASLTNLARMGRGRVLVSLGRISEGVALFDESMVAVTAGEVTPIVAGVVYCSVISACFELFDVRRAQAWTEALTEWCDVQANLAPYRGECLAHRAEIFRLRGRWADGLDEARRACAALNKGWGYGSAAYALAELYRLRGEIAEAEDAYRLASERGRAPQPGLALLRLAQGQREAARVAIDRVMAEPAPDRQRAHVLTAAVEILLVSADVDAARRAASELNAIAARLDSPWLRAMAASADGAIHLADGQPRQALAPLRESLRIWRDLEAPFEAARVSVLIGRACRALGDIDGAQLEWDAAASVFHEVGAAPALVDLDALRREPTTAQPEAGGLTGRELEVIRLIARGKTNRAIARELGISEKTVARHVSNIFTKLNLSSRAAATAYAFTHGLAQ